MFLNIQTFCLIGIILQFKFHCYNLYGIILLCNLHYEAILKFMDKKMSEIVKKTHEIENKNSKI